MTRRKFDAKPQLRIAENRNQQILKNRDMRVINPNANVGSLIIIMNNGKSRKLDVHIIRLLKSGEIHIDTKEWKVKINLVEKNGFITSELSQPKLNDIEYKIFHDAHSTVLKLEWEMIAKNESLELGKYYLLILFDSSDDFDLILKESKLEIFEL